VGGEEGRGERGKEGMEKGPGKRSLL